MKTFIKFNEIQSNFIKYHLIWFQTKDIYYKNI